MYGIWPLLIMISGILVCTIIFIITMHNQIACALRTMVIGSDISTNLYA